MGIINNIRYHGDTSATVMVGDNVDLLGRSLISHTKNALDLGISCCGPGQPFNEIGKLISRYARLHGYSKNN